MRRNVKKFNNLKCEAPFIELEVTPTASYENITPIKNGFIETYCQEYKKEEVQKMKKLYVMCGCPGSGKSTWIKNNLAKIEGYTSVVSRDEIRFLLVQDGEEYFSKETEVYNKFISDIKFFLDDGVNVIADATHLNEGSRGKLLRRLGESLKDVEVNAVVIKVPLTTALLQNEKRKDTRSYVPRGVIRRMYHQFVMPTFDEGFDNIYIYDAEKENTKYTVLKKEDK